MPHKSRVRRQTHVGSAPELLGEIGITFSFGAFPKAPAKLFPSCARRLQKNRRAPHGRQQAHRSVVEKIPKPTGASPFDFHCPVEILSPYFQPRRWPDRLEAAEERTSLRPILCGFYQEFPPPLPPPPPLGLRFTRTTRKANSLEGS